MTKTEKEKIIKQAKTLSNKELETQYYSLVDESLRSQAEMMYDMGYDVSDIIERQNYERFVREKREKVDLLEQLCVERGITLWN